MSCAARQPGVARSATIRALVRLALALGTVVSTAGCLPFPIPGQFDHAGEAYTTVDETSLRAVVVREAGPTETWWGACPKTQSFTHERWVYLLSYDLGSEPAERVAPRASLLLHAKKGRKTWRNPAWDEGRLPASLSAHWAANERRGMKRLEDGVDPQDREKLELLGFDTQQAKYLAEVNGARWYLGFDVAKPLVQVCSPAAGFVARTHAEPDTVHFGLIWDDERSRVVFVKDKPFADIFGLPRAATVWDYEKGSTTSYRLACMSQHALRRVRAPKPSKALAAR